MAASSGPGEGDLWVFAYGSLMWRPDFPYRERVRATLAGSHRSLCVLSIVARGTPARPGLGFGLDAGGRCRGIAYRVGAADRDGTLAALRRRELVTGVYVERVRTIVIADEARTRVGALCYVVDRAHPQYAGRLPVDAMIERIAEARGAQGTNRDYVLSTLAELATLGIRDAKLISIGERLAERDRAATPAARRPDVDAPRTEAPTCCSKTL